MNRKKRQTPNPVDALVVDVNGSYLVPRRGDRDDPGVQPLGLGLTAAAVSSVTILAIVVMLCLTQKQQEAAGMVVALMASA